MKNTICFENGIKHDLTAEELEILREALREIEVDDVITFDRYFKKPGKYDKALSSLKTLFLEHLD